MNPNSLRPPMIYRRGKGRGTAVVMVGGRGAALSRSREGAGGVVDGNLLS
jgi:hypothetical protein